MPHFTPFSTNQHQHTIKFYYALSAQQFPSSFVLLNSIYGKEYYLTRENGIFINGGRKKNYEKRKKI